MSATKRHIVLALAIGILAAVVTAIVTGVQQCVATPSDIGTPSHPAITCFPNLLPVPVGLAAVVISWLVLRRTVAGRRGGRPGRDRLVPAGWGLLIGIIVLAALVAFSPRPAPKLVGMSGPLPPYSPEPATTLLDREGTGTISWTSDLVGGRYGFRWQVTAGGVSCGHQLLLDGPIGPIALDDHGQLAAGLEQDGEGGWPRPTGDVTTGEAPISGTALEAGRYTLTLQTDCPGRSHLWVWRDLP